MKYICTITIKYTLQLLKQSKMQDAVDDDDKFPVIARFTHCGLR